jgi:hypothetical protein
MNCESCNKPLKDCLASSVVDCRRILDLETQIKSLQKAIRAHRDQRGDDRCWLDDETLYRVLPEGYTPPARDSRVELKNCEKFIACRHNPETIYESPEARISSLAAELKESKQDYNTLVGLLKKRFPQRKDGTMPDWAIEDVLRENKKLRKAFKKYAQHIDSCQVWRPIVGCDCGLKELLETYDDPSDIS